MANLPNRDECRTLVDATDTPFAGEPVFCPYFWEAALAGLADEVDGRNGDFIFDIDDGDVHRGFPELDGIKTVRISPVRGEDGRLEAVWTVAE